VSVDTLTAALSLLSYSPAFADPQIMIDRTREHDERDDGVFEDMKDLWKRKGGGGGGWKGVSGSSGGSKGGSGSWSSGHVPFSASFDLDRLNMGKNSSAGPALLTLDIRTG
jgi:hypothetical protein